MIQSENTIGGMTMNILTLLVQVYCSIMVLQLQYSQKRHRSSYIWQLVTIIYLWNVGSDAELALNQSKPVNKWPDLFSIVRCGKSSCTFKNVTIVLQTWIQQDVIGHLKKKNHNWQTKSYENFPPLPAPVVNLVAPVTASDRTTGIPWSISYCIACNIDYIN